MIMKYSKELFDKICSEIATSRDSLVTVCQRHKTDASAFYRWIRNDSQLSNEYACAREDQADYMADLIVTVAFEDTEDKTEFGSNKINRSRLKVDALKWTAAKLKPRKYGDKLDHTNNGEKFEAAKTTIVWGGNKIEV